MITTEIKRDCVYKQRSDVPSHSKASAEDNASATDCNNLPCTDPGSPAAALPPSTAPRAVPCNRCRAQKKRCSGSHPCTRCVHTALRQEADANELCVFPGTVASPRCSTVDETAEETEDTSMLENERLCCMIDDIVRRLGPAASHATMLQRLDAAEVQRQQDRDRHLLSAWRQRVSARARMLGEKAHDAMVHEAASILTQWQRTQEKVVPAVMQWLRKHNVPDVPRDDCGPDHEGGNGQVYRIGDLAVKVARPDTVGGADMEREARNMVLCTGCPYVIQLAMVDGAPGVITVLGMQAAVMTEYIHGLSVRTAAERSEWVNGACVQCMVCLLKAVSAMHSRGLVHGDIKPRNLVVDFGLQSLTLMDLGHAALAGEGLCRYGTTGWRAPELRQCSAVPGPGDYLCGVQAERLDMWACGVTMCCFAVGDNDLRLPPQRLIKNNSSLDGRVHAVAARNRGLHWERAATLWRGQCRQINHVVPAQATPMWKCIADCLQQDPASRSTAAALLCMLRTVYQCQ